MAFWNYIFSITYIRFLNFWRPHIIQEHREITTRCTFFRVKLILPPASSNLLPLLISTSASSCFLLPLFASSCLLLPPLASSCLLLPPPASSCLLLPPLASTYLFLPPPYNSSNLLLLTLPRECQFTTE